MRLTTLGNTLKALGWNSTPGACRSACRARLDPQAEGECGLRRAFVVSLLLFLALHGFWTGPGLASAELPAKLGRAAYIRQGDVWVKGLPHGTLHRLTWDGGYTHPAWSPSGRWLLVRKDGGFVVLPMNGAAAPTHVAREWLTATWAPNADRIAYRQQQGRLGVVAADGTNDKKLPLPEGQAGVPVWSPDGKSIAVDVSRMGPPSQASYAGLWRIPAEMGTPVELYAVRGPGPQCLTPAGWTLGAQFVLFWSHSICSSSLAADGLPLMAVPAVGGAPRELAREVLLHPDFVSSSRRGELALVAGGGRATVWQKRIVIVDPRSDQSRFLTPEREAAISPAWSSNGTRLAYVAGPATATAGGELMRQALMGRRIGVASVDGSDRRSVTDDPNFRDEFPLWLQGGRHLLFCRLDKEDHASLWLLDAQGGAPVRVTDVDLPGTHPFGYYGWIDWAAAVDYWPRATT